MTIHIRTWSGAGSGTVTDMTNAGKRGKKCRTIYFGGWLNNGAPRTEPARIHTFTLVLWTGCGI